MLLIDPARISESSGVGAVIAVTLELRETTHVRECIREMYSNHREYRDWRVKIELELVMDNMTCRCTYKPIVIVV